MVVTSEEGAAPHLHDDENQWRALCETRFGLMVSLMSASKDNLT